jgi:two-component system, cell cycle sensor histidine kinase and response regulator CckA
MTEATLRLLFVEDEVRDVELAVAELNRNGIACDWETVDNEPALLARLARAPLPDLILSDYQMPQFDGMRALELVRQRQRDIPFILLSGSMGEDIAVAALRAGADDYLLKDRLARLGEAVRQALARRQADATRARLAAIIEATSDFVGTIDAQGRVLYLNQAGRKMLGLAGTDNPPALSLEDLHPAWALKRIREEALPVAARGGTWSGETAIRCQDDREVLVSQVILGHHAPSGEIEFFSTIARDLTAAKRTERRLEVFSLLGRDLSEAAHPREAGAVILAAADRLFGWDAASLDLYDATYDRLQPILSMDIVEGRRREVDAPYQQEPPGEHLRKVIHAGAKLTRRDPKEAGGIDLRPLGDTSRRSLACLIAPLHRNDRVIALLSIHSYTAGTYSEADVADFQALADHCAGALYRLHAESELSASQARLETAVRAANVGLWDWDLRANTVFYSPEWKHQLGCHDAEISNQFQEWELRLHPKDQTRTLDALRASLANPARPFETEFRLRHKDGTWRWIYSQGRVVCDAAGEPCRMLGCHLDVTEKKKLETQFLRSQRMESLGTMASGIAHDLNNVLAPILMSAALLRESVHRKEAGAFLDTIETSAQRGAEIVKQVLNFGRGASGERAPIQPGHVIQEILRITRGTFPKSIVISSRVPDDLWTVIGDATQLHQVLLNFCVNARDAISDRGAITLSTANVDVDEGMARLYIGAKPGPHVLFEVHDTGSGIPPEVLDRIFDPFFTTKEQGKGTGLGLSTTLGIVKGHGGFVSVYSEPGKGTTMRAYLPASTETGALTNPRSTTRLPVGKGELILAVDDEGAIRDVVEAMLTRHGYRVVLASDGAEGVAAFATHRDQIRVVLSDFMMPQMDGMALARVVRKMEPSMPIILASGLGSAGNTEEHRADAARLGGIHFLSKPYAMERLLRTLHQLTHRNDGDRPLSPAANRPPDDGSPAPVQGFQK